MQTLFTKRMDFTKNSGLKQLDTLEISATILRWSDFYGRLYRLYVVLKTTILQTRFQLMSFALKSICKFKTKLKSVLIQYLTWCNQKKSFHSLKQKTCSRAVNLRWLFKSFDCNRGDTVSRRSPVKGVRPSPYTTLCS